MFRKGFCYCPGNLLLDRFFFVSFAVILSYSPSSSRHYTFHWFFSYNLIEGFQLSPWSGPAPWPSTDLAIWQPLAELLIPNQAEPSISLIFLYILIHSPLSVWPFRFPMNWLWQWFFPVVGINLPAVSLDQPRSKASWDYGYYFDSIVRVLTPDPSLILSFHRFSHIGCVLLLDCQSADHSRFQPSCDFHNIFHLLSASFAFQVPWYCDWTCDWKRMSSILVLWFDAECSLVLGFRDLRHRPTPGRSLIFSLFPPDIRLWKELISNSASFCFCVFPKIIPLVHYSTGLPASLIFFGLVPLYMRNVAIDSISFPVPWLLRSFWLNPGQGLLVIYWNIWRLICLARTPSLFLALAFSRFSPYKSRLFDE